MLAGGRASEREASGLAVRLLKLIIGQSHNSRLNNVSIGTTAVRLTACLACQFVGPSSAARSLGSSNRRTDGPTGRQTDGRRLQDYIAENLPSSFSAMAS